jgi:eukaryotic-like serine/threonine-protein kinase
MVGEVIADRYELEELVGSGGMSSVFKARDRLLDRHVALKVLHQHHSYDDEYVERFRREARAVARLSHPNIVTVIDRGEAGGVQFIVFEYVHGENLKQLVEREGPLPVRDAVELALGVARGLAFAHEHGLVHRDVKPQNVLLNGDGRPKVTDFGIARSLDIEHGVTQTGTVLGTSNYIAPEQASGRRVDAQTDVYALGVVLFELLTGEVPFDGENFVAVAMRHINEPAPSVLTRRGDVPLRIVAAVDRALAKDPRQRFPSMDAFAAELEACLAQLAAGASDPDATLVVGPRRAVRPQRAARRTSPWPLLLALLAALALGVIVVAAIALYTNVNVPDVVPGVGRKPKPAKIVAVNLTPEHSFDPYGDDQQEHDTDVPDAVDGNPSTYWLTSSYHYGGGSLNKPGVGFVVRAPGSGGLRRLTLVTDTPGFQAQIKASSAPDGGFAPVSGAPRMVGGSTTFTLDGHGGPYYLIWITKLASDAESAHVNEVKAAR